MARKRSLSTEISYDSKVEDLAHEHGYLPCLLYTWAIPHADDHGRLTADPRDFRLLVCPNLPTRAKDVEEAIGQIVASGLWSIVEHEGKQYIQFPVKSWFKYQSYIGTGKRNVPEAPAKTPKIADNTEEPRGTQNNGENPVSFSVLSSVFVSESKDSSPTPSTSEVNGQKPETPPEQPPSESKTERGYDLGYQNFLTLWPAVSGEWDGWLEWQKLRPNNELQAQMARSVKAWADSEKWQDRQFVPAIDRWLRGRRWQDTLPVTSTTPPPSTRPVNDAERLRRKHERDSDRRSAEHAAWKASQPESLVPQ